MTKKQFGHFEAPEGSSTHNTDYGMQSDPLICRHLYAFLVPSKAVEGGESRTVLRLTIHIFLLFVCILLSGLISCSSFLCLRRILLSHKLMDISISTSYSQTTSMSFPRNHREANVNVFGRLSYFAPVPDPTLNTLSRAKHP